MKNAAHAQQRAVSPDVSTAELSRDGAARAGSRASLLGRLATVSEMLSTLDRFTVAGQQYAMIKIVSCLQEHVASQCTDASGRARFLLVDRVHELACESRRPFPDAPAFNERAQRVLTLLTQIC